MVALQVRRRAKAHTRRRSGLGWRSCGRMGGWRHLLGRDCLLARLWRASLGYLLARLRHTGLGYLLGRSCWCSRSDCWLR